MSAFYRPFSPELMGVLWNRPPAIHESPTKDKTEARRHGTLFTGFISEQFPPGFLATSMALFQVDLLNQAVLSIGRVSVYLILRHAVRSSTQWTVRIEGQVEDCSQVGQCWLWKDIQGHKHHCSPSAVFLYEFLGLVLLRSFSRTTQSSASGYRSPSCSSWHYHSYSGFPSPLREHGC